MTLLKKCLVFGAAFAVLLAALAAAGGYFWATRPLALAAPTLDVTIQPRSTVRGVAAQLRRGGVPIQADPFVLMTRLLGLESRLKSGNYEFKSGVTPYEVLQKLALGDVNESVVTVIEGWTFKRMRAELDANPALKHDTAGMSDAALLAAIGAGGPGGVPALAGTTGTTGADGSAAASNAQAASANANANAEGLFFPDTYLFDKGTSDLNVYRRAYRLMQQRLNAAWAARAPGLPYRSPYEALTMASLIEKETGKAGDRPLVSAVFANRLRIGMPLQTDPAVIYGLGASYDGHLRKRDLQSDTPYNTYTRRGLPPTPIALPGIASLQAAMNPAQTSALYFVSRGDGSSVFSETLGDHNRAVDKYIRGQQ
ncbi:endolytic transglycosylase MltG [Trinickia sp. Y13]|uniref:endolytic transglycosylase MltG n=1 Tax=Trinickia sp. Y13 TaxID=2917807 RepID=UPI0024075EE8|nr:endolytic transglycosylase MltG [Trinickia sp. Y13]MDG0024271.1 endolytic transglycosylase MltG [Trinickia sp. Y13]